MQEILEVMEVTVEAVVTSLMDQTLVLQVVMVVELLGEIIMVKMGQMLGPKMTKAVQVESFRQIRIQRPHPRF